MNEAINEAKVGLSEGGIPIGSVLVYNDEIIGRGHNQRIQKNNPILHGEMDALQNAGRLKNNVYRNCILYSTLSPCIMCSGTIAHFKIPKIVIGENTTIKNTTYCEDFLKYRGIEVLNLNLNECKELMKLFIDNNKEIWFEDISI